MVLKVKDLGKSFGKTTIFKQVSFNVDKGEIVCIKGKSGEGKTTLLRCINDLLNFPSLKIGEHLEK